jgi:cell division protein FtsA
MKDKGDDKIIIRKNSAHYESITRKELAQIVDRKMDELLELIKKDLELAGIIWRVNCGIVVCGGMSFMDGIIEKIEHTIQLPTSLGIMRGFVSNFLGLSNIFYATSIGVVIYALHEKAQPGKGSMLQGTGVWGRMRAKMRNVYDEYF